ncbi:MAG: hypothetical protein LIR50_05695 [Bacillota bacterium]|nr:hypothetical protein [Bacillota bacterium]
MLKSAKSITLTGQSFIGETQAVYMSASVSTDGTTNGTITNTIMNQAIYIANKTECRKDISDFEDLVYVAQDEIASDLSSTTTTA